LCYTTDASKEFYSAINHAIKKMSVDIKNRTLNVDDSYTKSLIKLAESGDKIFNTLKRGKLEANGELLEEEIKATEEKRSFLDRKADKNKM